jgi:hypothetical protein
VLLPDDVRTFDSTGIPRLNERGELLGMVCIRTDVTGRKRMERMVKAGEMQLEQLADGTHVDAVLRDTDFVSHGDFRMRARHQ